MIIIQHVRDRVAGSMNLLFRSAFVFGDLHLLLSVKQRINTKELQVNSIPNIIRIHYQIQNKVK